MLETKDLRLDQAKFEDWEAMYHNVWKHWESARYMTWHLTQSEEEARERILRTIEFQKEHPDAYLVYEKATGAAIGFAGVERMSPPGIFQETGICLGPAYVGKGYGRQILGCLLDYCRTQGADQFIYSTREVNEASKALARSFGFESFAHIYKNDTRDGHRYKVLKFKKSL